jgi:hypothetical protein
LPLAVQQFITFAECCQVSFNRGPSDPLLGDGVTNFNCYIAPGVNVLSCYYYNGAACVLTQDLNICTSSEWPGCWPRAFPSHAPRARQGTLPD